jgi:hypothetical protein
MAMAHASGGPIRLRSRTEAASAVGTRVASCPAVAAVRGQERASVGPAGAAAIAPPAREAADPETRREPRLGASNPLYARALAIWPGLDRRRLTRTHGDPRKVARLVARRTIHSEEAILCLLRSG